MPKKKRLKALGTPAEESSGGKKKPKGLFSSSSCTSDFAASVHKTASADAVKRTTSSSLSRSSSASNIQATRPGAVQDSLSSRILSVDDEGNKRWSATTTCKAWDRASLTVTSAIDYIRHLHPRLPKCGARESCRALRFEGEDQEAWQELIFVAVAAAMHGKVIPFRRFDKFPWAVVHFLACYFREQQKGGVSALRFFDYSSSLQFGKLYRVWDPRERIAAVKGICSQNFSDAQMKAFVRLVLFLNWIYVQAIPRTHRFLATPSHTVIGSSKAVHANVLRFRKEGGRTNEQRESDDLLCVLVDLFLPIFCCQENAFEGGCNAKEEFGQRAMMSFVVSRAQFIFQDEVSNRMFKMPSSPRGGVTPALESKGGVQHEETPALIKNHEASLLQWAERQMRSRAVSSLLMSKLAHIDQRLESDQGVHDIREELGEMEMELNSLASCASSLHHEIECFSARSQEQLTQMALKIFEVDAFDMQPVLEDAEIYLADIEEALARCAPENESL
eukprot:TRINITY_DN5958_c0_g1_i2.p1 TRINITY_DN5958_c0_g1~~TRINITY_DN5958_c0_g1_i2.p1  ORF type:complete len:513 (-),score=111.98 TRINITY_DN5958_c0_g1_i2:112-1623(-)